MIIKNTSQLLAYQGRAKLGDDVCDFFIKLAQENNIKAGSISAIGALSCATLAYFDQKTRCYVNKKFTESFEVISLNGNFSIKDDCFFHHIHVMLGRSDFSTIGGHLMQGSVVYALEFSILALENTCFERDFDFDTGLYLLKKL